MTKQDEAFWKRYLPEKAIQWKCNPWAVVYDLESIMDSPCYTAREKLKLMQWAMIAYNDALNETSTNTTGSGRNRTSCPEHTED